MEKVFGNLMDLYLSINNIMSEAKIGAKPLLAHERESDHTEGHIDAG